jgi:Probable lipoprotein LpqN
VLSGCGSDTKTEPTKTTSESKTTSATTSKKAAPSTAKVAPRDEDAKGPNPTIANYIAENNIQETPIKMGDPGSPTIDLPVPDGWEPAGEDKPDWAYGAIVYTGPEAGEYTPSIVALVSKLTGNVDPQQIIDLAPGELQNLPGWKAMNEASPALWVSTPPTNSAAPGRRTARRRSSRRRRSSSRAATAFTCCSSTRTGSRIRPRSSARQRM